MKICITTLFGPTTKFSTTKALAAGTISISVQDSIEFTTTQVLPFRFSPTATLSWTRTSRGNFMKTYMYRKFCVIEMALLFQETGFFNFSGGVPASMIKDTNQQWDFPNGWAPLNHMVNL
jgi:hypothetical protein